MQTQNLFKTATLLSLFCAISLSLAAQTGPAGIGNKDGANGQPRNILWLDATAIPTTTEVATWADASGNGYNATALTTNMPDLITNVTNGNPVVRFTSGNADYMNLNAAISTATNGIASQNFTCFTVGARAVADGNPKFMLGAGGTPRFALGWNDATTFRYYLTTTNVSSNCNSSANVFTIATALYNSANTNEMSLGLNGAAFSNETFDTPISGYTSPYLGRNGTTNYSVDIAEVIFFQTALNTTQRNLIYNYLAAKYNLTITGDKYAGNAPSYWRDFRGIGQETDRSVTTASSAGFYITEDGGLENSEYILFAHDNNTNTVVTTDLPTGTESRWSRDWYLYKTGNLNAKLTFDFPEGITDGKYPQEPTDYVLLYRSSTTGAYSVVNATAATGEIDQISFSVTNANLQNGYYTIGTKNATDSPLLGKDGVTWYSLISGNWTNPETWTLDPSGMIPNNPTNGYPNKATDRVVIKSGKEIVMNVNNIHIFQTTVQGILNLGTTTGHRFDYLKGNGRLYLMADNFPAGDATHFITAGQGAGTVVYSGSSFESTTARTFYNLDIEMNAGETITINSNYNISNNLTIKTGTVQINSTTSKTIAVQGNLVVNNGASLTVGTANAIHRINVYGDLENHGTIDLSNSAQYEAATSGAATLSFLGSSNNSFSIDGNTELYRFIVSKGTDKTYGLSVISSDNNWFKLMGPVSGGDALETIDGTTGWQQLPLVIQNGTLQLGSNITIARLGDNRSGTAPNEFFIPATAMLWVDGATLSTDITGNANRGLTLNGTLKVSAGSFTIPSNTNGISYTNNTQSIGTLNITGGIVSAPQFRPLASGAIGNYSQTGGEMKFNSLAIDRTQNAIFSLPTTTSSFTMSGGQLTFESVNTYSSNINPINGIQIAVQEGNYNVDGGTVVIKTPTLDASTENLFRISTTAPLYNLSLVSSNNSGTQSVTITSNLTILNDLTIGTGTSFDTGSRTLALGGNFNLNNNGAFIANTSTLKFIGSKNSIINIANSNLTSPLTLANVVIEKDVHPTGGMHYNVSIAECVGRSTTPDLNSLTDLNTIMTIGNTLTLTRGDFIIDRYSVNQTGAVSLIDGSIINNIGQGRLVLQKPGKDYSTLKATSAETTSFGRIELWGRPEDDTKPSNYMIYSDITMNQLILERKATLYIGDYRLTVGSGGITSSHALGLARMIVTTNTADAKGLRLFTTISGSYTDNQIIKTFPMGYDAYGDIANPYVPVDLLANGAFSATTAITGYINVSPIVGQHPATAPGGIAMPFYWKISATGFSGLNSNNVNFRASTGSVVIPAGVDQAFYLTDASWQTGGTLTGTLPTIIEYNSFKIPGQAEITVGNSAAFSNPRTLYSTGSGRFYDAIWSTQGHNGTDRTIPQPYDIVVIGGTTTRNDSISVRDTSVAVTVAKLIIRSSKLATSNGSSPTFDMGPSEKMNLHSVSGGGKVIRTKLGEFGTYSDLSGDWDGFMYNDTAQFEYDGGYQVLLYDSPTDVTPEVNHGSYTLPTNFTVYPNLIIKGGSSETTTLPATNITVRKNLILTGAVVQGDLQFHPVNLHYGSTGGDVTVNGNLILKDRAILRFLSFRQDNKIRDYSTKANARSVTVKGNIIASSTSICKIETENLDERPALHNFQDPDQNINGPDIKHNLYVEGNIDINTSLLTCYQIPSKNGVTNGTVLNVTFAGSNNSTIYNEPTVSSTAPYNIRFNRIIINKSIASANVSLLEEFDLHGVSNGASDRKALYLMRGNLYIDHPLVSITLSSGGQTFNIPSISSLHVNNSKISVSGDDTGIWLDGLMEIGTNSQWLLNGGTNNYIEYSASGNAAILVQDGTLKVGSQIRRSLTSDVGVLSFTQNKAASNIIIGDNSVPGTANNRAMFEILNAGSSFVQTEPNSVITIARGQSATNVPDLLLAPTSSTLPAGSTFVIGNTSTPTGNIIDIQSAISLKNLTINSTNAPTARLLVLPLTIDENLTINSGASFDANSLNLTMNGNLTNSGTYTPGTNTTYFSGASDQTVSGSTSFYNLTKQTTANTLSLTGTTPQFIVNGNLSLLTGTLNLNGNTLQVKRNVNSVISTTSSGSSQGILFNGTVNQVLSGGGTFATITINNSQGVLIPTEGESTTITDKLRLQNGVLDIGKNLLTLTASAQIEEVSPFSTTNMIQTYISFTDAGIKKYFPAINTATSFTYPIGSQGKFTPVLLDITSLTSSTGYIRVKSANERHITINDRPETAFDDRENVLAYYWTLDAGNIDGLTALATLDSYAGDIKTTGGNSAADYITARLLDASAGTLNKYSTDDFNETVNELYFRFINADDSGIDGDYFAGVDGAIPNNIPAYQTKQAGNWADASTWDTYPVTGGSIPDGGPRGNVVVINHPTTVTTNYTTSYQTIIQSGGSLNLGTTFGNRLGNVSGQGRLILATGNMPAGVYDNFFAETGGTIEFAGTGTYDILSEINSINNIVINGTGTRRLPNTILSVNGDLTINAGVTLSNYNNQELHFKQNIHCNGTFTPASGIVYMDGNAAQTIDGTSSFNQYSFAVNNAAGVTITRPLSVSRFLYLTNGILHVASTAAINVTLSSSATAAIYGGSSNSFIDGTIARYVRTFTYETLPVGNNGRYAPIELAGVGTAGLYEAQFFNNNPSDNGMNTSSLQSSLGYVCNNEYWRVKAPVTTTITNIKLPSDSQSLVYPDDANLRGAIWTTSNNWNAVALESTGGSSTAGYVTTTSVSFNNSTNGNFITFGYSTLPSYRWTGAVSTDWFNSGNWDYNQLPVAITNTIINQTANQPIVEGSNIATCNNLTINSNASLTLNPGGKMTVEGNVVNNGGLRLLQTNTAPSSFINKGTITGSGNTEIQQTLSDNKNWYIGHAMNVNSHAFYSATPAPTSILYFQSYNTSGSAWVTCTDNTPMTTPMRGYYVNFGINAGDKTISQTGTLYAASATNQSIPLITGGDRWNLIANPYPSFVDLKNSTNDWDLTHIEPTIMVRTKEGNTYKFLTFNTSTDEGSTGFENGLIAPMQAFWVRASSTGSITAKTSARVHPTTSQSLKAASTSVTNDVLRIVASNKDANDETVIVFRSIGSEILTGIDSEKRMDKPGVLPQLSSVKDNTNIAINIMPEDPTPFTIPLALTVGNNGAGNLVLSASNIDEFMPDINVYLRDLTTGTVSNLRESPSYSFTTVAVSNQKRFELFFRKASEITTGTENDLVDHETIEVYSIDNKAVVIINDNNFMGEAVISLYDTTGKLISNSLTNQERTDITLSGETQMIIIKVAYKNQIKAFKILKPL